MGKKTTKSQQHKRVYNKFAETFAKDDGQKLE